MNNYYSAVNVRDSSLFFSSADSTVFQRQCCGPGRAFSMSITDNSQREVSTLFYFSTKVPKNWWPGYNINKCKGWINFCRSGWSFLSPLAILGTTDFLSRWSTWSGHSACTGTVLVLCATVAWAVVFPMWSRSSHLRALWLDTWSKKPLEYSILGFLFRMLMVKQSCGWKAQLLAVVAIPTLISL